MPLIDVMPVLLITLILSLLLLTHAVRIDLPHGQPTAAVTQPEAIDLEIYFDGTVVWNGVPVRDFWQLEGYFRTEAQKQPQARCACEVRRCREGLGLGPAQWPAQDGVCEHRRAQPLDA